MVFTSLALFVRNRGPDEFWRKRKILKLSAVRHNLRDCNCVMQLVMTEQNVRRIVLLGYEKQETFTFHS
jgi:hypothetical protein